MAKKTDNQDVDVEAKPINNAGDDEEKQVELTPAYIERGVRVEEIADNAEKELWDGNPPPDEEEEEEKEPDKKEPVEVVEGVVQEKEEGVEKEVIEEVKEVPPSVEKEEDLGEMRTIKVDGVEQQVPLSKIEDAGVRALQKEATGDQRLKEANEKLKEVGVREAKLSSAEKVEDVKEEPEKVEPPTAEKVAEIAHAQQYGTDEEAQQGIRDIVEMATKAAAVPRQETAPAPTVDEIVQAVKQQEFNEKFAKEFPEIAKDPGLYKTTRDRVRRSIDNDGLSGADWTTYEKAVDAVMLMEGMPPRATKAKEDSFKEKQERKKSIDNLPPVSQKVASTKEPDEEESPSEIIAEIATERGQNI